MAGIKQNEIRKQLRELSDDDLHKEIATQRAALYDFRRRHALKQTENPSEIRASRKQIARALTILREREIAAENEAK